MLKFKHQIQVYSIKPYWFQIKILPLLALKWHILTDDHCYTMLFERGTPLNNPPIEIHANSSMFALIFWPHVTIFCIFWLHKCLKWILEFNSKSLFDANLGKFSRYERLNSAITNFSWYTCLLTSADHDIIPMAYHPCMFVLNFFLNRFVMLRL